jgi:hypothetical protein
VSFLVTEISKIIERIVIVTTTRDELFKLFEALAFELTTDIALAQPMDLQAASSPEGPLLAWTSFTLGRRARLDVRISVMGYALEHSPPTEAALELCEGLIFWIPESAQAPELADKFLSLKMSRDAESRPCILAGVARPAEGDLRAQSLIVWGERHFPKFLHLPPEPKTLLKEGLEWVLSF